MATNGTSLTPSISKEKEHSFRVSQLNLLQNESIANRLGTSSGRFDVEKAVDVLLETRKSNKFLTKVIVFLVAYSVMLTIAVFGVSIAAAEIAKDTTIDPSSGFVRAKHGENHPIARTVPAVEFDKPDSIHGLLDEDLARLLTVKLRDGAIVFQVKGFSSTEEKTMLLVEGGILVFDDTGLVEIIGDHPSLLVEAFAVKDEGRKLLDLFSGPAVVFSADDDWKDLEEGEWCSRNTQCKSGCCESQNHCATAQNDENCVSNQCAPSYHCIQLIGGKCDFDHECESKFCHHHRCKSFADNGEHCVEDSDCDSKNCRLGFCLFADVGKHCTSDSDCKSGQCHDIQYCL